MTQYEEADEYCPHCDNHYVSTASIKLTQPGASATAYRLKSTCDAESSPLSRIGVPESPKICGTACGQHGPGLFRIIFRSTRQRSPTFLRCVVSWLTPDFQVIEAKEPKPMLGVEGEDARVDNRMLKDDREKEREGRSLFGRDLSDKIETPIWKTQQQ